MKYSSIWPSRRPGISGRGPSALTSCPGRALCSICEPHIQHLGFDDRADIHAVLLRHAWIARAPAVRVQILHDAAVAIVTLAAHNRRSPPNRARDRTAPCVSIRIRRCADHLRVKFVRIERLAAGAAHDVLREAFERADARTAAIQRAFRHRFLRGAAFEHLEAIARREQRARWLVEPVIGAPDALHQPRRALRRANLDHEIDIAPVDAEIERRGANHRLQLAARHRRFDLAALADIERTMVQRDGKAIFVDSPELLKCHLRLRARVDEHQRRPRAP